MNDLSYEERVGKLLDEFRSLSDEELDEMRGIRRVKDFNGTLRNYPSKINVFEEPVTPNEYVAKLCAAFRKAYDEMTSEERLAYDRVALEWSRRKVKPFDFYYNKHLEDQ